LTTINPNFPAWASGYKLLNRASTSSTSHLPAWTSWTSGHKLRAGIRQKKGFPRAMYLATSCPTSPWVRPGYLDMVVSGRKIYIYTYQLPY